MGLNFILGSSGAGKTRHLYQHTIKEAVCHPDKTYLVIVPEQFTLQTQKDLILGHPNKGIMNIDVLSFLRLAYRVFEETGKNNRIILEDTGKSMIVKKVLLKKKQDLKLFGGNINRQGFVDEMKSMLSELFQYSIGTEELDEMAEKAKNRPSLLRKIEDIRTIYEGFREFLQEKYITTEEILDVLSEAVLSSVLVKGSVLYFDGYTGFTPSQYKLLHSLLLTASELYVTVTIDPYFAGKPLKEHQLFYLSYKTVKALTELAVKEGCSAETYLIRDKVPYRFKESKALAYLEKHLFRYEKASFLEDQEDIQITAAKSREEEVAFLMLKIKQYIREGLRYSDIAVVTGDIAGYEDILQRAMEQAGIPCFIDYKRDILNHPLAELLRAALNILEHNYSYEAVFRLLKTGLLGWTEEEIDRFELYVTALGIRGYSSYKKEWKRTYRTSYEVSITTINELRQRLFTALDPLYQVFHAKQTVKECLSSLYVFFRQQHLEEKLLWYAEQKEQGTDAESKRRSREYRQVYSLVMEVFDRIAELLGEDVLPVAEFRAIVETGLAEAKVGLIPPGTDQVVAGDIERTRLKDIKLLFFLGVNDGIVPKVAPGGGILSDADRQLLSEQEVELAPTKRQISYTAEFYLYLNLTKPQKKLFLSFIKLDADGKAAKPSYLIGKLLHMFPRMKIKNVEAVQSVEKNTDMLLRLLGTDYGLSYLADGFRAAGIEEETKEFYALYHMYQKGILGSESWLKFLADAAFYTRYEDGITSRAAEQLYGATLLGSVTRMEKYAACAFSHFLAYGLSLEERAEYKVALPDLGTLYHMALEKFSEKLKQSDKTWRTITEEECMTLGSECVTEACKDFGNGIFESSSRNAYLLKRVERVLKRTLTIVREQVSAGLFEPELYEYAFLYADQYLNLRGRIDRMDLCEKDGRLFVRVVDYKSGNKSFDLNSLYYGLELQLGVYLSAGIRKLSEEQPEKEIIPAGVFYYNLEDPIVEKSDHTKEDIKKQLAMNGLANESKEVIIAMDTSFEAPDGGLMPSVKSSVIPVETTKNREFTKWSNTAPEKNMKEMLAYVDETMHRFSKEIMNGATRLAPFKRGDKTACGNCPYSSACGFDPKLVTEGYRKLPELPAEEIWARIRKAGKQPERKNKKEERRPDAVDKGTTEGN